MVKSNPPTTRARYIASLMRETREKRKLKAAGVADHLGKTAATISRYESGEYPIPGDTFIDLLDLYGIDDPIERASLIEMNEDAPKRGWVDGFKPYIHNLANNVWMEGEATKVQILELVVAPGITQTRNYAHALISNGPNKHDPTAVKRQVEARLLRSRILESPNAPEVELLMHESILDQRVGGDEVTAEQLERLLAVSGLPNVTLRLLPRESWAHLAAGIVVGYTVFHLPEPLPSVVYIDSSAAAIYEEDPDIGLFKDTFDALMADVALSAEVSTKRIAKELKDVKPK
ncbi:helix-turn-helix domain-containing protein [Glycomyces sp. TRM65418]|uniref:helix-turn-helix domain-containing protein n=1 Tax=Glycomyces sp. TRM65418 TaxID=2867006 RepID=UPI001CE536AE|nr:helix-turn-helix transcriptional regulator [Glycomyces sp. TRM65418]MCC3762597.1 helix-turn-helix domain-containing protein [Glycomyces sp. TRM65418]QZD56635.1 helix-turn-helix domain-containing protein [Glycomyces sp. TRM65418]